MTYNFENLTSEEKREILLHAKEILRSLHDEYDGFPYEDYWNGTSALASAAAWVDNNLILPLVDDEPYPFPSMPEVEDWIKAQKQAK